MDKAIHFPLRHGSAQHFVPDSLHNVFPVQAVLWVVVFVQVLEKCARFLFGQSNFAFVGGVVNIFRSPDQRDLVLPIVLQNLLSPSSVFEDRFQGLEHGLDVFEVHGY